LSGILSGHPNCNIRLEIGFRNTTTDLLEVVVSQHLSRKLGVGGLFGIGHVYSVDLNPDWPYRSEGTSDARTYPVASRRWLIRLQGDFSTSPRSGGKDILTNQLDS